jgi:hypothetical protein
MKKLLFILSLTILLVACGKSKEQIVEKCLLQANQTFPTDMTSKIAHFEGCMVENNYSFNDVSCDMQKPIDALSSICYRKD